MNSVYCATQGSAGFHCRISLATSGDAANSIC